MADAVRPSRRPLAGAGGSVTTTDAWKLFAITFVLIDHYGFFFDSYEVWWRLFGRLASPVFFFFIGFARTRTVPLSWIAFGILITAVDHWTSGGRSVMINILINFALLRLVLPAVEAHVMPYPSRLALVVAASAALIPVLDPVLEYGGGGWLWALFGLAHRLFVEGAATRPAVTCSPSQRASPMSCASAPITASTPCSRRSSPCSSPFSCSVSPASAARPSSWQPTRPIGALFSFVGRHTLEIYAVTLLAMQVLAYAIR